MAALCAWDLTHVEKVPVHVIDFGQPRVGNPAFASSFNSLANEWRVTHWNDIVVHLPPEALGFHHTATEFFYNEANTSWKQCDGSGGALCGWPAPGPVYLFLTRHHRCRGLKLR